MSQEPDLARHTGRLEKYAKGKKGRRGLARDLSGCGDRQAKAGKTDVPNQKAYTTQGFHI